MTTGDIASETTTAQQSQQDVENPRPSDTNQNIPQEITEIFEYLSENTKIVFKSQQINDPELERWEKIEIAKGLYEKNRQTFLLRFGSYMDEHHLISFERLVISENPVPLRPDEYIDEIQLLLEDYQQKLHTRKRDVRNRRYTAMQQLIKDGEYFSEQEMMKRAPELYQELVGQYLSTAEKKQRDSYDVKNTTFSGILMHTMQTREMDNMLKDADKKIKVKEPDLSEESQDSQIDESNSSDIDTERSKSNKSPTEYPEDEIPMSYRQQWGRFDNVTVPCSISRVSKAPKEKHKAKVTLKPKSDDTKFITAGERDLLRQEFVGIMHEKFLEGKDAEFDYTQVDDNTELDDLQQINQDKEDAYFEGSDDDDNEASNKHRIGIDMDSDSEDELDIYMNHLNQHPSLQK